MKKVIINSVVSYVGVFKKIVFCVLNNELNVSDVMCEKVLKVFKELDYMFNFIVCGLV